jgi:UDP-N-acetylmuramyl pentapeptide phosphotransferase/UDP-N-acetylglucosamine-1-phosphate transferase
MSGLRILALVLVILGVVALVSPAITYTTREEVLDVGPIEVTKEKTHRVPYVPILGGVAIVLGIGLLISEKKTVS